MNEPNQNRGFKITFAQITAVGALLTMLGVVWSMVNGVATKSDLAGLQADVKEQGARLREVERTLDRFFGTHGPPKPTSEPATDELHNLTLVAFAADPREARRVVVTQRFIAEYNLRPAQDGAGYLVKGEDGQFYALDDVLAILVRAHK